VERFRQEVLGVKLEAVLGNKHYDLEVRDLSKGDAQPTFEIALKTEESAQTYCFELLSRCSERWTFRLGSSIEDFIIVTSDRESTVDWKNRHYPVEVRSRRQGIARQTVGHEKIGLVTLRAQMPGRIVRVLRNVGDLVETGDGVVVIEAMKMQNEIGSPKKGTVVRCDVREGESVSAGQTLFEIE
jgi:biotin carboxyl carrier protein